jgi:hypothetical protein
MDQRNPLTSRYMRVDDLVPYARNARKHPPSQIATLATMIRQFGFRVPVLVHGSGSIIAGHGRVLAAKQVGASRGPDDRLQRPVCGPGEGLMDRRQSGRRGVDLG